jgi:predicted nucleic acid-binding protein
MVVTDEAGREDTNHWLIDKSALIRLGRSAQAREWALRIERGLVRITTVTLL